MVYSEGGVRVDVGGNISKEGIRVDVGGDCGVRVDVSGYSGVRVGVGGVGMVDVGGDCGDVLQNRQECEDVNAKLLDTSGLSQSL